MSERHFPVRPNLLQLKHQAKDLLRDFRAGDSDAIADFQKHCPKITDSANAKLADAQFTLAKTYGIASWPRLVLACNLIDAICRDDVTEVRQMIVKHPNLLHEMARGTKTSSWGPPMSYAANLGRDEIIRALYDLGARDLEKALGRATLQSKISTARLLHNLLGKPLPPAGSLGGPAYTLSVIGTQFVLEQGAKVVDEMGRNIAPVDVVLETDSRKPAEKHQILELYVRHGLKLPDTPTMAVHRGRIDLLEQHLARNPQFLNQTFTHEEIFPPELDCHDEVLATHGTPLAGTTLLHMAIDFDEIEIIHWLIDHGIDVNARATIDPQGFGGHTALFATVVSQPNFRMNHGKEPQVAPITQLLLDHGADPNVRASLRKQLHPGYGPETDTSMREFRDVTPLSWGQRFHAQKFVSQPAMKLIAENGGHA